MNNYRLVIQYDGTNYAGWQIQKNSMTVQEEIIKKIKIILKEDINLIGSGRTDSGVHALGQTGNFRCSEELDIYKFKHQLNSILPRDISIIEMEKVDVNFHARFDAKKRSYLYLISQKKSPFFYNYSYFCSRRIDSSYLNFHSKIFSGEHNFQSFCRKNTETENKICNISFIHWKEIKGLILFIIEADRFLHGMVRTIAGTLLEAEKKGYDLNYLREIMNSRERELAGESLPAKGLFLYKVKY